MNTRKELILHIGQYKTGSSSIQNFLIGYTDFLASKSAHYCRTGLLFNEPEIGIRHYKLTENTETGDCLWDKLVDEINSSHSSKFIVSHENMLFRLSEDNLTYIKQKLVNFDLKIVCYLRRQDKFMSSWYGEQVQNHHCCSNVSDFIRTYKLSCFYGSALKKWRQVFPDAVFEIHNFDTLIANKQDVVRHFLGTSCIEVPINYIDKRENASMSGLAVSETLAFNRNISSDRAIHRGIANLFGKLFISEEKLSVFSNIEAENFIKEFSAENELLCDLFGFESPFFDNNFTDITKTALDSPQFGIKLAQLINYSRNNISPSDIDTLRDSADIIVETNPAQALNIMKVAQTLRPSGTYINKRVLEMSLKVKN